MTKAQQIEARSLMARYSATGRTAFLHPRKGNISLNGRTMKAQDAMRKMREFLSAK